MAEHSLKVGDELAFRAGYGKGSWFIRPILRITPSGRLVTDLYTVNPDLTIRGRDTYGPFKAQVVTPQIREAHRRQKLLNSVVAFTHWTSLSTDQLAAVVDIITGKTDGRQTD